MSAFMFCCVFMMHPSVCICMILFVPGCVSMPIYINKWMNKYIYMYISITIYNYINIYICVWVYIYINVCMYVFVYLWIYICVCVFVILCIFVCMCLYICLYMFVCFVPLSVPVYICMYKYVCTYISLHDPGSGAEKSSNWSRVFAVLGLQYSMVKCM